MRWAVVLAPVVAIAAGVAGAVTAPAAELIFAGKTRRLTHDFADVGAPTRR